MTTLVPQHLEPTMTDRGFAHLPELNDRQGGNVGVCESSAASEPCVWLTTESADGQEKVTLHLPAAQAWRLAEQIVTVVRNHYHGDATPVGAAYEVKPLWMEAL